MKRVVDLSAYNGQSISLQIRAETNSSGTSNLYLDDVWFQSTLTAEPPSPPTGSVPEPRSKSGDDTPAEPSASAASSPTDGEGRLF